MPSNSSSSEDTSSANGPVTAAAAAAADPSSTQPAQLSPTMAAATDSPQASSNSPSSRPLTPAFAVQTAAAAGASDSADDLDRGQENTQQTEQQQATTNQTPSPHTRSDASAASHSAQLSSASALAAGEEMLALLSAKKRALLSEIGALLTLRERLQTEMRSDHEKGVPFDYAVRFAHSPATLAALEAAADEFREQMRAEGIQIAKTQRIAARSSGLMMSPGVRTSTSAVAKSALAFAQSTQEPEHPAYSGALFDSSPLATPVQTPSKVRSKKVTVSTTQPTSSAAARPHTAPASRASSAVSFTSPSVQAYPPIHESAEEEPDETANDLLYNGIHAEESVYFDAFEGDEAELQQPLAQTPSPAPRSFLQSPMPPRQNVRPSTAAAAYTPNTRQQQQYQHAQTHRDAPRSTSKHSVSSSYSTPPHALYDSRPLTSSASRPSSRAFVGASDSPLGFCARKALLKQQAEQETLASFSGKTLGGVAQEGLTQENKHLGGRSHYLNFNPQPHGAAHEAQFRPAHHAQQQRHAPQSPARNKPLQNITNSSTQRHAHSATKQTHSTPHKESHSQQQTTARGEAVVRW